MKFVNYEKEVLIINNYIQMNRFNQALDRISELLEENSADSYLIYLYSYCHYKLENYEEALNSCRDALDSGFSSASCCELFCKIYTRMEQYEEAEEFILAALEIKPQDPDFLAFYGYLMMLMRKNYKALELLNEALAIDPENLNALHYKFYYYLNMDDTNGIKSSVIEKYFSLEVDECDRFLKAGLLDYHNYDYDSALENFMQAFQLDPTNKFVLKMLERINKKPRFFFHWKRILRKFIMNNIALMRVRLKVKWTLFKCVGLTRDTMIFVIVPIMFFLLIALILLIIIF
jgi:tetratricopeptide (TPR) repeat protein